MAKLVVFEAGQSPVDALKAPDVPAEVDVLAPAADDDVEDVLLLQPVARNATRNRDMTVVTALCFMNTFDWVVAGQTA